VGEAGQLGERWQIDDLVELEADVGVGHRARWPMIGHRVVVRPQRGRVVSTRPRTRAREPLDASAAEDAVAAGTDEASHDQEHDPEQELTLDQLYDADDGDDYGDEPQDHLSTSNVILGGASTLAGPAIPRPAVAHSPASGVGER